MNTRLGWRTASTTRRALATAGAMTASALLLGACGLGNLVGPEHEDKVDYSVTEKVTELTVETGAGDITVVESDRSGIAVTERLSWRGADDAKPRTTHAVAGERLTLTYDCPGTIGNCGVTYEVQIPRGVGVKADSGSGRLILRGLSGAVEASTGSGDIEGEDLTGKRAVGKTGSGDVELRFGSVPDDVEVDTGSGNGVVRVPAGAYNVTAETGSGDELVEVNRDGGSSHKIVVKTGAGDAKVLPN